MKKLLVLLALIVFSSPVLSSAASITDQVRGRILLQVESVGEAWYVNPEDGVRTYLPDGSSAFELMRYGGLGISNFNLEEIPSVADVFEMKRASSICSSNSLANSVKGRILLQVESVGEAWYVYPENCHRIYMRNGEEAYQIMRYLGLGITNEDLEQVPQRVVPTEHIRGAADAEVTVIEYCDLEGPFCQRVQATLDKLLVEYEGQVNLIFRHFPLSFHPHARMAAEATECAADQKLFWEYHDLIYDNQSLLTEGGVDQLKAWATNLNMNRYEFDTCLDSNLKANHVDADIRTGEADGVTGTPFFLINGKELVGAQPYNVFVDTVERELGNTLPESRPSSPTISDHLIGALDAPVTIIKYSDFECPYCQRASETLEQLLNDYSGQVQLIYRHFPLSSIHEHAQKAAEASECAADQGAFWTYHDLIFANQSLLSRGDAQLKVWASELGLNRVEFDRCLDTDMKYEEVKADYEQGVEDGVTGTPGFLINGELVHGAMPYDVFAEIIESKL